ncbi:CapA family protein [Bacillus mesophilus]|uniref:CapA family protein n=2 Tax=Bacillus mesophilus TaxID=1808955 RepID=A0A6M0Q8M5_9BACI|nr:CapA family protein [Bacillus mesophilus]
MLIALTTFSACSHISVTGMEKKSQDKELQVSSHPPTQYPVSEKATPPKPVETTIKISVAGDFTIGSDESFGYHQTFVQEADQNGLEFFVQNIKDLFSQDDFTSVNLETTLTNSTQKADKKFRFKGTPEYTEILKLGSIEAVNLANNHTFDYLQRGYSDTVDNLTKYDVGYFGNESSYLTNIKGIDVGALGYNGWNDTKELRSQIETDIKNLRNQGAKIIIVHFHWGEERSYVPNSVQKSIGRFTIDQGADLVVGHHPHVVQGIEEYNGKFIVYSLGNFMFGGNRNPSDKDTFVFQQVFHLTDGELVDKKEIKVIPFRISSTTARNNYQPTPLDGDEAKRVLSKIYKLSAQISEPVWVAYDQSQ